MFFWRNCYGGSSSVNHADDGDWDDGEARAGRSYNAGESKEAQTRSSRRSVMGGNETREVVVPSIEGLDSAVTAAILTQAAFRGYRLRHRLRRLPAREAERTIRALHANAQGFRNMALFLVLVGLFFCFVNDSADVAFKRTVYQGLENHLAMAKYGPGQDRTHADVTSLSELYQWMQAFYLNTYHGTELEDRCTACAVKPPDEVCNTCDFDIYDANIPDPTSTNGGSTSDEQARRRSAAVDRSGSISSSSGSNNNSRSRSRSSNNGNSNVNSNDSNDSSASSANSANSASSSGGTGGRSVGLSEECEACVVGRLCTGRYLELCAASLDADSATSPPNQEGGDAPVDVSSAPSSDASASDASVNITINATALNALVLDPVGGVSAARGHIVIENASQCSNFDMTVGVTETVAHYYANLTVFLNRMGFVADRNRIIGGMLVKFTRRMRLSEENCEASRGYFDVCLADREDKETIIPEGAWAKLRPDKKITYTEVAGGYTILIDTGGYNTGLNRGLCALLVMEDRDIIPPDEVKSVSVQLATYNGNKKSAFGAISVDFNFEDGGQVTVSETITTYVLKRSTEGSIYRMQWVMLAIFMVLFVGMVRQDTRKWWRRRSSKSKRTGNCWHCACGFSFFALMFVNVVLWLVWSIGFSDKIMFGAVDAVGEIPNIDSLSQEVVALQSMARFASTYYFVFLLTTMAGLYRWIFQILTFHKRMSIVADTLSGAYTHLQHFLFVAFLVALVFTSLTWLLVGTRAGEFSTPGEACRSVVRVTLGEYDNFYPQIMEAQPTVGPIIVVVYQVLGVVLLLNVVIAVLLEAYRVVAQGMKDEDTILQSLAAFVGMTLCTGKARVQWANAYLRWWFSGETSRQERRPSLKLYLRGPNTVWGVDGRPVLLIRSSGGSCIMPTKRQLSFNCPRYISVTDMHTLIEAAPVPAFVADRLVRKIVNHWIFRSSEKTSRDKSALSCLWKNRHGGSSGDGTTDSIPTLRRREYSAPPSSW